MTIPDPHEPMPNDRPPAYASGLSSHILPTSATMVGVCMTVLAIRHLPTATEPHIIIDKLLAVDALLFLVSGILSFASIRDSASGARFERYADTVFLVAQGLLAIGAILRAFVVT